jgi:hypothetical protein
VISYHLEFIPRDRTPADIGLQFLKSTKTREYRRNFLDTRPRLVLKGYKSIKAGKAGNITVAVWNRAE